MKNYIKLIRPKHWIKNLLIFIPLFFNLGINQEKLLIIVIGFFSFSFIASSVYIFNDICDIENDKKHSKKKERPIASGAISVKSALCLAIILIIIAFSLNIFTINNMIESSFLLGLYYFLNILYSKGLKNVPIVDIFLLSSGFIIRLFYGSVIVKVPVSEWLLLTTLNASLFLGIGKRKKELNNKKSRKVLEHYTEEFLNKFSMVCIALTIMFYSLWVMNQRNDLLYFSIPMIIFIIMQYMLTSDTKNNGDPVTVFFGNKTIIISTVFYILYMIYSLYFY